MAKPCRVARRVAINAVDEARLVFRPYAIAVRRPFSFQPSKIILLSIHKSVHPSKWKRKRKDKMMWITAVMWRALGEKRHGARSSRSGSAYKVIGYY